jgi:hypothetical protein
MEPKKAGVRRREFFKAMGIVGLSLPSLTLLSGCGEDGDAGFGPGECVDDKCDWFGATRRAESIRALLDIILPSRPGSPGAIDAQADLFLRSTALIDTAIGLGYLPDFTGSPLDGIATSAMEGAIVGSLDTISLGRGNWFSRLSRADQEKIVADAFANPVLRPMMELVRTAAMFAYVGAIYNDKGLVRMGFPPYRNHGQQFHNDGFPNFSYNRVPTWNGVPAWEIVLD